MKGENHEKNYNLSMLAVTPGAYASADDALAGSAILNYTVNFVRADTVFIWQRGYHEGGGDDSYHAGIDGVITEDTHRIGYHGDPTGDWQWLGINMNSTKPKFYIDGPGQHIFQVYIREDGLKLDKLVLTTDREYDPVWYHGELGPDETLADDAVETIGFVAASFLLDQNYPNPFNPETTICYRLPHVEHITLTVFDLYGKKIKTLVNENKASGQYQVSWNGKYENGESVASGVYVYRMTAGAFVQGRKMLLVK